MLASSARSCATGRALQLPGLNRRRTTPWFAAPEFADLAAIADFNGDRYAIPALSAEDVALAPAAALLAKRSCSFAEWFSFSAPGSGLRSYIDASGQWGTDLPPHAARFDWSNGRRQLALNESAANLVTNSRGIGAAAGTPGVLPAGWFAQAAGLSIGVTRTGTEDGLPYVDIRYRGVTSANFGNAVFGNVSGVVPGSGHSLSAYLSLVAGTATAINLASLRFRYTLAEGGSVDVATAFPLVAGALKQARVAATDAVAAGANGSGIIFVQFNWSVGVSVDFTIRVALPQLEVGPFASPAIPTASGTLVRPAETAALGAVAAALLRRASSSAASPCCAPAASLSACPVPAPCCAVRQHEPRQSRMGPRPWPPAAAWISASRTGGWGWPSTRRGAAWPAMVPERPAMRAPRRRIGAGSGSAAPAPVARLPMGSTTGSASRPPGWQIRGSSSSAPRPEAAHAQRSRRLRSHRRSNGPSRYSPTDLSPVMRSTSAAMPAVSFPTISFGTVLFSTTISAAK